MAVLRFTFAGNYAVQGTETTAGFYNDKPSLHKTNLSQIAKVSFNKNPTNPHTKHQQTKLIPVELSWSPEWFSFCRLFAPCFGKQNDACPSLAGQETESEICCYFFWRENLKKTGSSCAWTMTATTRKMERKQNLIYVPENNFRNMGGFRDEGSGIQFYRSVSYFLYWCSTKAVKKEQLQNIHFAGNFQTSLFQVQLLLAIPVEATEIRIWM